MNKALAQFEDDYKPLLQRLQQSEEGRINFLKHNFEKLLLTWEDLGKNLSLKSCDVQKTVAMINSETDLKIFIDEHATKETF